MINKLFVIVYFLKNNKINVGVDDRTLFQIFKHNCKYRKCPLTYIHIQGISKRYTSK